MYLMFGKTTEIKKMKDYDHLYLKCDVLLLAGVFETFRNSSLKNYGLFPSHYLGTPGLRWDAMLKMKKPELELIPDPDMYICFGEHARGGISYISNRYSNANNKYLKSHEPIKFLPTNGFKWIDPKGFDLNKYTSNSSKGCVLEVDLEFSK